jgi:glyoxylase-like metal-dependent hydrolase (beta-lactamase superfamily II)
LVRLFIQNKNTKIVRGTPNPLIFLFLILSVLSVSILTSSALAQQQTNLTNSNITSLTPSTISLADNFSSLQVNYYTVPDNARGPAIPEKGYVVESLGGGLYFLSNGAYNTMFMVTEGGVIVVDAPPVIGDKYLQAISEVSDKPVRYFVYSHAHKDHVGAANIFPDNTTYIAQEETAKLLRQANDSNRPLPNITFTDRFEIRVGNEPVLELAYHGVNHEAGNIYIYAPKQKALMFVDVVYPGWVPFDRLGGSENVTGFMATPGEITANYKVDKFIGGHLTRIGTMKDIVTQKEFISDLKATAQQVLRNVSFGDIAKAVGPTNPGNPWAITNSYLEVMTKQCTMQLADKWKDRLGGVDIYLDDNCAAMLKSLRLD